ncbi:MAG: TRL domain-containing protein [bacterium]
MKVLKVATVVFGMLLLASCYGGMLMGRTPMGLLYANEFGPISKDQGGQVIHGNQVQGKSCASSILGLIATGDASILAAEQDALSKAPGSTKLTNTTIDFNFTNILGIYSSFCTIVTGVPVR